MNKKLPTFACLLIDTVEVAEDISGYGVLIRQAFQHHDHLILAHSAHALGGETPAGPADAARHCKHGQYYDIAVHT